MIKKKPKNIKERLTMVAARWMVESYPGSQKRLDLRLFFKDVATYIILPGLAVFVFESLKSGANEPIKRKTDNRNQQTQVQEVKSQIISFNSGTRTSNTGNSFGVQKRAPGTLVKIKLQNVVETYGTAPVHAQIIDQALGRELIGSILVGDATSDSNFERIQINFKFVRDSKRDSIAVPITARALSLNGTLGVEAVKKEGFFARATLGSTGSVSQGAQTKIDAVNLNDILLKALASGFLNEASNSAQVQNNRAQVLTLSPGALFFAELTDFFPGSRQ